MLPLSIVMYCSLLSWIPVNNMCLSMRVCACGVGVERDVHVGGSVGGVMGVDVGGSVGGVMVYKFGWS